MKWFPIMEDSEWYESQSNMIVYPVEEQDDKETN